MLKPSPRIGETHLDETDVRIGILFHCNGSHAIDRSRHEERIVDLRQHQVIDVSHAGQLVAVRQPGADQQFVGVTQHVRLPHHPVHVDVRQIGDPPWQGVVPRGTLLPTPQL